MKAGLSREKSRYMRDSTLITSAPIVASHSPICGPLMIQLKSVTRIPSSGSGAIDFLPRTQSDNARGAQSAELSRREPEPPAQNFLVVLAEERCAARRRWSRGQADQRSRIAQVPCDRMVDFNEGAAVLEMGMLGGLGDGQDRANRQSQLLPLAHQPFLAVLEQLSLDQRAHDVVVLGALRGVLEQIGL